MKKIGLIILSVICLFGCSLNVNEINSIIPIEYEEIKEKNESKKTYVLYIGRSDCNDCKLFEEYLNKNSDYYLKDSNIYYLDIKKYKDNEKNNDIYQYIKSSYALKWVPTVYFIVAGRIIDSFSYLDKEYHKTETEEVKNKIQKEYNDRFKEFFGKYKFYAK